MSKFVDIETVEVIARDYLVGKNELDAFMEEIRGAVTSGDVAPVVRATWNGIEYDGYADGFPVYEVWECSNCGEEHRGEENTLTRFCPHCGAKMDAK